LRAVPISSALKRTVFFAHRTKQRLRIALAACVVYALVTAAVAVVFPREGLGFVASFCWWLCAIPVCFAVYVVVEAFGTWSLGLLFWQRMPSSARVLLLVVLIGCIAVAAVFVNQLISRGGSL
jgi:hypothetical protein